MSKLCGLWFRRLRSLRILPSCHPSRHPGSSRQMNVGDTVSPTQGNVPDILTTYNLSKHLTSQLRQRYCRKQKQPPVNLKSEFLKAGLPLPRTTTIGEPGFSEFLINFSWISKDPRTTVHQVRLTLEKWSRGDQIRPEPLIRMNKRILT